ncbi:hypothetical protein [Aeoliella sp.]|uniref:hypothetical protein n=1 Tax=Aeoliella sp. TaxID=2795800 RepID=UPI003CCB8020
MDYRDDERESRERGIHDPIGLPDPNGPVMPVTNQTPPRFSLRQLLAGVGFGCVGLALIVPALQSTTCAGATRSSRLKWQKQQALIDQAISEQAPDGQAEQHND